MDNKELIAELIKNTSGITNDLTLTNKIERYKIKDIVFLAIIVVCTLIGGAVMPLLVNIPVFGIIELGLGLQFSIFPVIGILKVRKFGSLIIQSIFISFFLIFMFPPMVLIIICAIIAEVITFIFFRGYKNDYAAVLAGTLYMPLTIPLLYFYYNKIYTIDGSEKGAVSMYIGGQNPYLMIGISLAVVVLCFIGSLIGMLISKELRKSGVIKK